MIDRDSPQVKVWDPFVRFAHWTIALGFFVAYLTEDDALGVHVWAGYVVGALVVLRVIWGFVGPRYARFADFVSRPRTAIAYLWDLFLARAPRHLGHSPAGGAMVLALLGFLAATVATGLVVYAEEEGAGPLAALYAETTPEVEQERESAAEVVHEVLANVTLALVILHVLGVALASYVHRENLVRAMITGWKRSSETP